jgi:hypothetical protein
VKKLLLIVALFIIIIFTQNCSQKSERDSTIEKIKSESIGIFSEILTERELSELKGEKKFDINMDSVNSKWMKEHKDSAELGLKYIQQFDSIYNAENNIFREYEKTKKEKEIAKGGENITQIERL